MVTMESYLDIHYQADLLFRSENLKEDNNALSKKSSLAIWLLPSACYTAGLAYHYQGTVAADLGHP